MKLDDMTLRSFIKDLASDSPAPGGGAAAGLLGALGAALASMVANLALGNAKYETNWPEMKGLVAQAEKVADNCLQLMNDDAKVFDAFMAALRMPKNTDEEKAVRAEALQKATREAIDVPLATLEICDTIADLALAAALRGNKGAITDAAIAAHLACTSAVAASYNVRINLKGLKDEAYSAHCRSRMEAVMARTAELRVLVDKAVDEALA